MPPDDGAAKSSVPAPSNAPETGSEPAKLAADAEPSALESVQENAISTDTQRTSPGDELAGNGTWYLDDATYSIRYRPQGHADELLQLLLDVAAAASRRADTQHLFPRALAYEALRSCTSCHSISREREELAVNWKAAYRDPSRGAFTTFSHRPHVMQPALSSCTHCHQLNPAANTLANYEGTSPHRVVHDFLPLQKNQCVSCHNSATAGGQCTQCHDYHIGLKRSH
jgi:hypothetical protein